MTEKRFTLTFDDKIVDNLTGIIHDVHSGYDVAMDLSGLLNALNDENEQLKQQLNKIFVLIDIKQNISKENMEEWAFKDVPASTSREYYYSGMLDACMQLRDEILNGDVE